MIYLLISCNAAKRVAPNIILWFKESNILNRNDGVTFFSSSWTEMILAWWTVMIMEWETNKILVWWTDMILERWTSKILVWWTDMILVWWTDMLLVWWTDVKHKTSGLYKKLTIAATGNNKWT